MSSLIAALMVASIALPASGQTLAGGDYHVLVVKPDGTVWAFGWNAYGPLGDGTETARSAPGQVSGLSDIVAVAAGERRLTETPAALDGQKSRLTRRST